MQQQRELAPIIGRMVVSGKILEGDELADYLQRMPSCDFSTLIEDMVFVSKHDHTCNCGTGAGCHETGTLGCIRFMTEAPAIRPDDHWFVDGQEITDYTLRQQQGYYQHDCGCWSRRPGSDNSIDA